MNILIIGSGGREHALTWILNKSKKINKLFVAPGNAGTAQIAENISIPSENFEELYHFCKDNYIQYIIVGPEAPLVKGIFDYFMDTGIYVIGPSKGASQLEGSKAFAKAFMQKYNIPTAPYRSFTADKYEEAKQFLYSLTPPYVIKVSGLAAGKGVFITYEINQAIKEIEQIFNGKFGQAGRTIVIEQFLSGIELSVFIITDGKNYKILPTSKDYKRIGEGDSGLNTGGMGAISPMPMANKNFLAKVEEKIIKPTIYGLRNEGLFYRGFLYFGLMKVGNEPYVLEYNVRLGDPEAQAILPRIDTDFVEIIEAMINEEINNLELKISDKVAATIVVASKGYPLKYEKNKIITGLNNITDSIVFHAGTQITEQGIITNGGRVLSVTSLAPSLQEAINQSYKSIKKIKFDGMYYRRDIGYEFI